MRKFIEEISKPIPNDGAAHIDYVPSQISTEYFRHIMPKEYKIPIHGIKYYSMKCPGKVCYVLFCDVNDLTQNNEKYEQDKYLCLSMTQLYQ